MDARVVGGLALLGLLLWSRSSSAGEGRGAVLPTPQAYGAGKVPLIRGRWQGPLGERLRAWVPQVMPGADPLAVLGFTSIGGADEDTAPVPNNVFHEVGEFQTPAGPAAGPAPNPDPVAPYNRWGLLGAPTVPASVSADARELRELLQGPRVLGRPAVMAAGSWRGAAAIPDRAAMGLGDLALGAKQFARLASELLPVEGAWDLWRLFVAFSAFSAGVGGAVRALSPYRARLAVVPQGERLARLLELVAADVAAGLPFAPAGRHGNRAYTVLRGLQKLEAGRQTARALGLPLDFWAPLPDGERGAELGRTITRGASGQ